MGATAVETGAKALRRLGFLLTVYGAWNEAEKSDKEVPQNLFNKQATAVFTFVGGIVGGAIDDATMACPARAPFVVDFWEQNNSGPAQQAIGDFFRWTGKW
jgi:hypothetical protein